MLLDIDRQANVGRKARNVCAFVLNGTFGYLSVMDESEIERLKWHKERYEHDMSFPLQRLY